MRAYIGRFPCIEKIGEGGFGTVYKCRRPDANDVVAIKICEKPNLRKRFFQEAAISLSLEHRNIVNIFDIGFDGKDPFIVEEFLDGRDLRAIIDGNEAASLGQEKIMSYICQLVDAVAYAHSKGVIHRDINPSNIRIIDEHLLKVIDFGLAKVDSDDLVTQRKGVMGTPGYIAPEQYRGESEDERTDVFMLGVVFLELFTGKNPFRGQNVASSMAKTLDKEINLGELRTDCPAAFVTVVSRCVAKEPQDRFDSAEALQKEMMMILPDYAADRGTSDERLSTRATDTLLGSDAQGPLEMEEGGEQGDEKRSGEDLGGWQQGTPKLEKAPTSVLTRHLFMGGKTLANGDVVTEEKHRGRGKPGYVFALLFVIVTLLLLKGLHVVGERRASGSKEELELYNPQIRIVNYSLLEDAVVLNCRYSLLTSNVSLIRIVREPGRTVNRDVTAGSGFIWRDTFRLKRGKMYSYTVYAISDEGKVVACSNRVDVEFLPPSVPMESR